MIKDSVIGKQHIKGAFKSQNIDEFITLEFISGLRVTKLKIKIEKQKYHESNTLKNGQ
jgi:hypothetical protein